ncbi:hypothetical protein PPYR_07130 [Photinus pyralis]|uniref:RNA-directed DNA polymerase n=1 Tax=Photinus pyralis TaxID=7054 RepID=A0A5N4API6_PHOPY|nr:hypothetical protein PPYR_07130 [Photinus pyralis]
MESLFKPPDALNIQGNLADNWKKFEQRFDLFMTATDLDSKDQKKQIAVFLSLVGEDGLDIYNSFTLTAAEKESLKEIKKKFADHCAPQKNVIYERFVFNSLVQKEGQTFDSFVTDLKIAVKTTEYADPLDMVRDRIVMGIFDKATQERLLREKDLTLEKAVNFCRAIEVSKFQAKALQTEASVSAIKMQKKRDRNELVPNNLEKKRCGYCGYNHTKGKCSAFGKVCGECNGKNHFASVCRRNDQGKEARTSYGNKNGKRVNEVKVENSDESECSEDNFYVKLKKTNMTLIAYGNSDFKINPIGEINLNCELNDKFACLPFVIVDSNNQMPLLGLKECLALDLIKRIDTIKDLTKIGQFNNVEDIVRIYPQVFSGLGCFPSEHKIVLKQNYLPHVQAVRRIPQALHQRVKHKLIDLESQGIIRKVEKPTEWLNPLVIVEKKNGDLRLCLDPKFLNQNIQREHFLIPTAEEIAAELNNKAVFTVLDMKDGYFQVKIDNQSSDYCTFGTPFGRYQFCRLPFGISSAPELLNYDLKVTYKPGKYLYIADTLSRAFLTSGDTVENTDLEYYVHSFTNYLPMSAEKKNLFKETTRSDEQLKTIINFLNSEWPSKKGQIPLSARHFYKLRGELFMSDGLLFFNHKLVVPKSLRPEMLIKLHEGHLGIEKVKARARQIFYWPSMICEKYARKNVKETLKSYPVPDRPWERIGADIFSYGNNSYLVTMDAYSSWLELVSIKNKSAHECVIMYPLIVIIIIIISKQFSLIKSVTSLELRREYNLKKKEFRRKVKQTKQTHFENRIMRAKNVNKETWSIVNSVTSHDASKNKNKIITLNIENSLITDDLQIANCFGDHFATAPVKAVRRRFNCTTSSCCTVGAQRVSSSFILFPIVKEDVMAEIRNLKNCSPGPDGIPVNVVKLLSTEVTDDPNYPKSNGLAEKAVDIAKKLLKKSLEEGKDIFDALIQYRNSPLKYLDYSPAQLLMSRICRTKLPISADLLKPTLCKGVREKLQLRLANNEKYYNKTATDLKTLKPDQNVTVFNHIDKTWTPGKIIDIAQNPRSYKHESSSDLVQQSKRSSLEIESPLNNAQSSSNYESASNPPALKSKVSGRIIKKPKMLDL